MHRFLLSILLMFSVLHAWGQQATESSISIKAEFDGSYLGEVEVKVLCSTGSLLENTFILGPGETLNMAPAVFTPGRTFCQVRVNPPLGYSVAYSAGSPGKYVADRNGCQFSPLEPGHDNSCTIEVTQDPVALIVYKEWIGGSGADEDVQVTLDCESGEWPGPININEGRPGSWQIRNIDPEGILCNVSEDVRDNFRPDIIDCQGLLVLPGKGEECTLINTKIVKHIEMLNRYGLVIMILLVLGIGLAAVRRFS
jgi:hypothetical protein